MGIAHFGAISRRGPHCEAPSFVKAWEDLVLSEDLMEILTQVVIPEEPHHSHQRALLGASVDVGFGHVGVLFWILHRCDAMLFQEGLEVLIIVVDCIKDDLPVNGSIRHPVVAHAEP